MRVPGFFPAQEEQLSATSDQAPPALPAVGDAAAQLLYTLIAQQPFFAGLNPRLLQLLAEAALEVRFAAGEEIFHEGSAANRFYLILEGKVVLESEQAERRDFPIQMLRPGDDLGWAWLFPPYLFHLSARALVPTRAILFYGTRLREQCEQDHELGFQLMQRIAEVLIQQLQTTRQRLVAAAARTDTRLPPSGVPGA